jgi:hypothetical protein
MVLGFELFKHMIFLVASIFLDFCMVFLEQSDSEYMAGQLSAYGYGLTEAPESADLWLINT